MLKSADIKFLVVHCSDCHDSKDQSASDIHAMHLGFGWHGIGYHRVIRRDGKVESGRPDFWIGAHVRGFNDASLGVCLVGRKRFSNAQLCSLERVLRTWKLQHPDARICGHCAFDYTDKTCPNFDVPAWCAERGIEASTNGSDSQTKSVSSPAINLYSGPGQQHALHTQCLFGEQLEISREQDGWTQVTLATDNYQGWVECSQLVDMPTTTHRVLAQRTFILESPTIKSPIVQYLSLGSHLVVVEQQGEYSKIALPTVALVDHFGYVPTAQIVPLHHRVDDWVSISESLLGVPYRWGGRDSMGLDCSALLQLSLQTAGVNAPRDSVEQVSAVGHAIEEQELERGDLVFWQGHVGIMQNSQQMIHANAYHMQVASEPLHSAIARIGKSEGPVLGFRRVHC